MHLTPRRLLFTLLLAAPTHLLFGQSSVPWQQHVAYEMDITLLADRHQLRGTQRLTYVNASPDTLDRVFYHLYFNAFQPGSMMAQRNRHLPDPDGRIVPRIWRLEPDEAGYHQVLSLTQDGTPLTFEVHDTVMRVVLATPIPPGGRAVFEMAFRSQVPLQTRRSGRDNREGIDYSMSQWYPKVAAYDSRGWHADPYVGREFYGPFGTFEVRLTLPAEYVVGATGVLQNPEDVGHGYSDVPLTHAQARADSLTWHFRAENVHDFAWAADPDYLHDRLEDETGITYHLLYQPDVAEAWQRMRAWVPALIQFYSAQYGRYPYPQFTVAQAGDGGMEYPMINFITGRRGPLSLLGTTAHEAAHEWFYGALGSNEADYAWLDEGFANYASAEAVDYLLGRERASHLGAYLNVLYLHHLGLAERMNTPSDWFASNSAYGIAAYSGGEMLVDMLGYVLSDPVRDAWLRAYVRRFTFRHPAPYDVEKTVEDVSGLRLDWFFEQFANTTRTLDYAVETLDARRTADGWATTLALRRIDEAVMPADVLLTLEDGSQQWINIPLGIMQGHKPVPADWMVADPWYWTAPAYTLRLTLPQRPVRAELDPLGRTPDRNRLNNRSRLPVHTTFLEPPGQSWFSYDVGLAPLGQYAFNFGAGAGLLARGQYLFEQHQAKAMLKVWPQVLFTGGRLPERSTLLSESEGSFFDGIDYAFSYTWMLPTLAPLTALALGAQKHLGVLENRAVLARPLGRWAPLGRSPEQTLSLAVTHQYSPNRRSFTLHGTPGFLQEHVLSAQFTYRLAAGDDLLEAGLEVGTSLSTGTAPCTAFEASASCAGTMDRGASLVYMAARKSVVLSRLLRGSAHIKLGLGLAPLALQKQFRLGQASAEAAWRQDAFRYLSSTFQDAQEDVHLFALQGPGPVAYALGEDGYAHAARHAPGTPSGSNLLAGSLSVKTAALSRGKVLRPLRLEVFSGIGTVWEEDLADAFDASAYLADAGIGLHYDLSDLARLSAWTGDDGALRLVAKFPLWVSHPEPLRDDDQAVAFRWLVGLQVGP